MKERSDSCLQFTICWSSWPVWRSCVAIHSIPACLNPRTYIERTKTVGEEHCEPLRGVSNVKLRWKHRTEIIGSGLSADSPRHFPSRLFYPRFDVPPTNSRTNPAFASEKITSPTTSAQKRYPPINASTKKSKKSAPIPPPCPTLTSSPPNHCFPPTRPLPVRFPPLQKSPPAAIVPN